MRASPPGNVSAEFISLSGHVNCSNLLCTEWSLHQRNCHVCKDFFLFRRKDSGGFLRALPATMGKEACLFEIRLWKVVCVCVCVCVHAHVLSCFSCRYLTLCNPMDCTHQAPLSKGFSRQEYRNGLPCPPPGDLLNPGIECTAPVTPALDFFLLLSPQ